MKSIKVLLMAVFIFSASSTYATTEDLFSSNLLEDATIAEPKAVDEVTEKFEDLIKEVLNSDKTSVEKRASLMVVRQFFRMAALIAILSVGRFVDYNFINPEKREAIHVPGVENRRKPSFCDLALEHPEKGSLIFLPLALLFDAASGDGTQYRITPAKTGALSTGSDLLAVALLLAADFFIHANDKTLESLEKLEKYIQSMEPKEKKAFRALFKDKYAARFSEKINHVKNADSSLLSAARSGMAVVDICWALMIVAFGAHGDNHSSILVLGGLADLALVARNLYNHPNNEKGRTLDRIKAALA